MCRQPVLSFHEARSLISSACPVFLSYLVSLSVGESSDSRVPYDVPVVSEFVDVFPDELPGLPPHREVEFGIAGAYREWLHSAQYVTVGSTGVVCEEERWQLEDVHRL